MKIGYGFTPFYVLEEGCSNQAGQLLAGFGYKKVMAVYDKGTKDAGLVDGIIKSIEDSGLSVFCFDGVRADPPDTVVEEAARLAAENHVDGVIAVGGGSAIDTAKGINVLLSYKEDKISKYYGLNAADRPLLPLIAVPTTSGTGSEVSFVAVITDTTTNMKQSIVSQYLYPTIALVDPALSSKMPPGLTAATGMDALAHAIESNLTSFTSPMSSCFSEKVIELIFKYLPRATKKGNDLEARENMALAASLGMMGMNGGMASIGHGIGHSMGAQWHIPHGIACALALPYAVSIAAEVYPDRIRKQAKIIGLNVDAAASNAEVAKMVSDSIRALYKELGLPTLKKLGVDPSKISDVAANALKDLATSFAPKPVTYEEILGYVNEIYEM